MTTDREGPVVVRLLNDGSELSRCGIADVVVSWSGDPGLPRCRELLTKYPGLTLAIIVGDPGSVTALLRDGTIVAARLHPGQATVPDVLVTALVQCLWAWWVNDDRAEMPDPARHLTPAPSQLFEPRGNTEPSR